MEQPLGEALARLENTGTLSILGRDELAPAFRGYRVGKDGVPIFEYDLGALHVEDRVEPTASRGLRRTLRVSGRTGETVQFSARPPAGVKVQVTGVAVLPVKLEFRGGNAELMEEISW
jgi:hypothetical protein